MSFALLFAVLMLLWLFFGITSNWPAAGAAAGPSYRPLGGTLLLFVLLLLLGWKTFGPLLHP